MAICNILPENVLPTQLLANLQKTSAYNSPFSDKKKKKKYNPFFHEIIDQMLLSVIPA